MHACPSEDSVLDFVEGRLPEPRVPELERHLGVCPSCSQLVAKVASAWFGEGRITAPAQTGPARTPLLPGAVVGRYRIIALLGAGGMGEVYRARDERLGRDVALKRIAAALAGDREAQRRFEYEARAAGSLNHPNIVAVYDAGTHEDIPYLVAELVEGETLRERLRRGPLGRDQAVAYALQMAQGLAAAHERGIVHRDLKPDNLLVTAEGQVKILDFGLAKLRPHEAPGMDLEAPEPGRPGARIETGRGIILGTVGYMSPEQACGEPVDHRTDLFALGAVLYEMRTGRPAFAGLTPRERLEALLSAEVPAIGGRGPGTDEDPALETVVRRLLEKDPRRRYQSALDLAFHLEQVVRRKGRSPAPPPRRRLLGERALVWAGAAALLVGLGLAATALRLTRGPAPTPTSGGGMLPVYHQFTFRHGHVLGARFSPDGHTIVYGAEWDGEPLTLFQTRTERPDARPIELAVSGPAGLAGPAGPGGRPGPIAADILGISVRGEMAVSLGRHFVEGSSTSGTLARVPLPGGGVREVLAGIQEADWSPDGNELAVVRVVNGHYRIEWGPGGSGGKVLYESPGWVSSARISPRGDLLAFLDHPGPDDDRGAVKVVDRQGRARVLADGWTSAQGLAWAPAGDEVWFTAAARGGNNALHAVRLDGQKRLVARSAGRLVLHDVARDGRALVTHGAPRMRMMVAHGAGTAEEDLSGSDASWVVDLSADGRTLLYAQAGEGEGTSYASYLRGTDGAHAVRLGDGLPLTLSPDGRWALALAYATPPSLVLLPTGPGEAVRLPPPASAAPAPSSAALDEPLVEWASWFPDGRHIVYARHSATEAAPALWIAPVDGGAPRRLDGILTAPWAGGAVAPDGSFIVTIDKEGQLVRVSMSGGPASAIAGSLGDRVVMRFAADGQAVLVRGRGAPIRISRIELGEVPGGGRERLLLELPSEAPQARAGGRHLPGFEGVLSVAVTPDGQTHAYSYVESFSSLYLLEFPGQEDQEAPPSGFHRGRSP